ncbi:MAG: hypothetical protein KDC54_04555 [Lewinella sp.]|nr:hypothetical protein [Lewinella sp.]
MVDEFVASWEWVEAYFRDAVERQKIDVPIILATVIGLRARGYDTRFRAGQSLYNLVISRASQHGRLDEQARIHISPGQNLWNREQGEVKVLYLKGRETAADFRTDDPLASSAFMDLLEALEQEPIV